MDKDKLLVGAVAAVGLGLLIWKGTSQGVEPGDDYKRGDVLRWVHPDVAPAGFYVTIMEVTADSYRIAGGYYPDLDGSETWYTKETFTETIATSESNGWIITLAGRVTL